MIFISEWKKITYLDSDQPASDIVKSKSFELVTFFKFQKPGIRHSENKRLTKNKIDFDYQEPGIRHSKNQELSVSNQSPAPQ